MSDQNDPLKTTPPKLETERPLPTVNKESGMRSTSLIFPLAAIAAFVIGMIYIRSHTPHKKPGADQQASSAPRSAETASPTGASKEARLDAGVSTAGLPPPGVPLTPVKDANPGAPGSQQARPGPQASATPTVPPIPVNSPNGGAQPATVQGSNAQHQPTTEDRRRNSPLVAQDTSAPGSGDEGGAYGGSGRAGAMPHMQMPQFPKMPDLASLSALGGGLGGGSSLGGAQAQGAAGGGSQGADSLGQRLIPTKTVEVTASVLQHRDYLLTKGSFLGCILETKINTAVPGLVVCRTSQDMYGSTGRVVVLDRGTKLTGEYQGSVKRGENRVFVVWSRAETPNGVVINLDSPGTDSLGEAGLGGYIDSHFWERFGSALLLSVTQDAVTAAATAMGNNNTSTTINTAQDAASIAVENTINIPPTLIKNQGERLNIMVARDLDFSGAYELKSAGHAGPVQLGTVSAAENSSQPGGQP